MSAEKTMERLEALKLRRALEAARVQRSPAERWLLSRPADNAQTVNAALAMRLGTGSRTARLSVIGGK